MAVEAHGGDGADYTYQVKPWANHAGSRPLRMVGLPRNLSPGAVNNLGGFYDGNFTDLYNDDDEIGQFTPAFVCTRISMMNSARTT